MYNDLVQRINAADFNMLNRSLFIAIKGEPAHDAGGVKKVHLIIIRKLIC